MEMNLKPTLNMDQRLDLSYIEDEDELKGTLKIKRLESIEI